MDQEDSECISAAALRDVLEVLGKLVYRDGTTLSDRVTRIDVSETRVTVEFQGATPNSNSKPEEPRTHEQTLRDLLPGAVLPERPKR